MEATEVWSSRNLTNSINCSGERDIFLQRQMGPHCIVVPGMALSEESRRVCKDYDVARLRLQVAATQPTRLSDGT